MSYTTALAFKTEEQNGLEIISLENLETSLRYLCFIKGLNWLNDIEVVGIVAYYECGQPGLNLH